MLTEKTFDTGEVTLHYAEEPSAYPPLVLLHGLTGNREGWYPLFPGLAANWHLYAVDLRGHGKSGRAPDARQYRNADYARDVIAFLKHIGEPAVVMGHSLGAMVGIVTAAEYPVGVRALILFDPPLLTYTDSVYASPAPAQWFELVASIMKDNPSYETVVARLREKMPDAPDEQINGTASSMSGVAAGAPETALRDEIWQGVDLPQALQQIACPVLMIHGDWDAGAAMREQDIEFFKTNHPSAVVVHLPGADHGLKMTEQPDIVLQHVNAFLQSV